LRSASRAVRSVLPEHPTSEARMAVSTTGIREARIDLAEVARMLEEETQREG
jgi:hypothetical protein